MANDARSDRDVGRMLRILFEHGGLHVELLGIAGNEHDTSGAAIGPEKDDRVGINCGSSTYEGDNLKEALERACFGEVGRGWERY